MTSNKKQQSISSFFTAKPSIRPHPPTTSPPNLPPAHASAEQPTTTSDGIFVSSDEDEEPVSSRRSSAKRGLSQISENVADAPSVSGVKKFKTARRETSTELHTSDRAGETHSPDLNGVQPQKKPTASSAKHTNRTSKYLFSANLDPEHLDQRGADGGDEDNEDDEDARREKDKLHKKFVKKLGRPDSINEIKRRNHFIDEAVPEGDDDDDEPDEEAPTSAKKGTSTKKAGQKLTPMEKQVIDIKKKHADTVLVVEVGYKFRFFGEDARVAARELSIVCIPGKFRFDSHPSEAHLDRFASASIPVHRLHVHVKRLVQAGHKVGVVRQLETAALKAAGDNRNTPFVRQLTNLYTKGTYIDDVEGLEAGAGGNAPATGYLLCLTETNAKGWGTDEKVHVGIVAVQPATGDIIYDDFEDGFMRGDIETRLLHVAPSEFLIVGELSKATEKLIHHLSGSKTNVFGDKARVERVDKPKNMTAQAYNHVSKFYAEKLKSDQGTNSAVHVLDKVHRLSDHVTICLSAMITHLSDYGLHHVFDLTKNFQAFSARSHMLLNANTLNSLEVYRNSTDYTEKGSLFWVLDQTRTRFGQRLLRKWVGRPLLDMERLQERVAAVGEFKDGERTVAVDKLKNLLGHIRYDLEKSLLRIYYKRCSRSELLNVLQTMHRIATEYAHVQSFADAGFQSQLITDAISSLPKMLDDVISFLDEINSQAAKDDDKYNFLLEQHETSEISEHKQGISNVEEELETYKKVAAEKLRTKRIDYATVAGIDYLIEVDNGNLKNVPASWIKISGTKKVSRFHSPEIVRLVRERDQHKESLAGACDDAFMSMLAEISAKYHIFRECIQSLATLDALMSLAEVASRPDYVKPTFTDEVLISVKNGRHPMVEQLLLDSYVPNDIELSSSGTRALLITGPNMGGKSSYVRQVALISIMGQIGSYVPAESAELGMLDAVFTRMGAFDNMMAGESTFMVELSETSDILKQATSKSLIILDELGRGTSTHDGVAIAHGVLDHIVRDTGSLLLFITHYQTLSAVADGVSNGELKNMHMRFTEEAGNEQDITFLYELGEGTAHRSYGLNVARLANVPDNVIETAKDKSQEMELGMHRSKLAGVMNQLGRLSADADLDRVDGIVRGIEQL